MINTRWIRENGLVCLPLPIGDGESSFCGFTHDAGLDEPGWDVKRYKTKGAVTCPDCVRAIHNVRDSLAGVRLRPATLDQQEDG